VLHEGAEAPDKGGFVHTILFTRAVVDLAGRSGCEAQSHHAD
jgi:hypothetical protein